VEKERAKKNTGVTSLELFVFWFFLEVRKHVLHRTLLRISSVWSFSVFFLLWGCRKKGKGESVKNWAEVRERTKWRLLILLFDPSGNSQKTASGSSRNATNLIAEVTNTRVDTPPPGRNELLGELL
jgi:hypothetical protein